MNVGKFINYGIHECGKAFIFQTCVQIEMVNIMCLFLGSHQFKLVVL
jgi:hypothetical protein